MESALDQLDRFTDEPTKQMLRGLIKRKRKYENYKKQSFRWQAAALICAASFCLFVAWKGYGKNSILGELLNDSMYMLWILSAAFAYSTAYFFKKKEEKAEADFHKLRCEIIQKSTDLWPQPEEWKSRETVYKVMKQQYDINLYFESK
ncbi:YpbF family protein [Bacillus sonorensis]|uniref:Membrane protein YpbF n=1 Tax=Bacillus sonorensis L12 TaxID=1274524 RepID=M5PFY0_9BACI|nr:MULTISPECIES: YpbF family protein [Bacillus]EME76515.1 membrane protein YpbF [Bacillus sonorensis L12]MBG9915677.1 hypothetical protein [Bacillus sonorensis]MCF7618030.1 YpbF family protein [Bacillus sonorensis]MCY7856750.1 YpbF family protein [Bacillus sonorensis]MCY8024309.1 YpbF family protein [Bacillus sonorensis]